ncbi:unnamed protein product [Cylindrotheca closterium]|uniref:Uncharacterized protein n=1 Tax=Cylindrotheca closterium TaxID=2856 RepID=A0AAD2FR93_9STRA|nr:unnamed protein product [Cylindrotheca closterium]
MLRFCSCGEDLALAEMFAETVAEERTVVVGVSSTCSDKPTSSTKSSMGNATKRSVSDYFGEDKVAYESRIVYKEIQDDSWLYDDLRLFTYDCKGEDDDSDILDSECEMPLHYDGRDENTERHLETPSATGDKIDAMRVSQELQSLRTTSKRKKISRSDRMETPLREKKSDVSVEKKKRRKQLLRATDRDEMPYIPVQV